MPAEEVADLSLSRRRVPGEVMVERHQNAGGAEAALERVVAAKRLLQHAEPVGRGREPFDRLEIATIDLRREREAGPGQHAVDDDGAGAAEAVLAADMRTGCAKLVAQEIGEQHARLRLALDGLAVECETDGMADIGL